MNERLPNKEMKQTKPAMARMARSSLLISVLCRPGNVRVIRPVADRRSAAMLVLAFLLTTACGDWMVVTSCPVRGTIQAGDGVGGIACTGRLSSEHPSEAKSVGVTGEPFEYPIAMVASGGPPFRAELIVSCDGYEDSVAYAFEVRPGRLFCVAADVGVVTIARHQPVRE